MNKPLPTNFVLLVNNDSNFLLDLLTLLYPNLKWRDYEEQPNKKYENCNEHTAALFIESNCLTYLNHPRNQENYHPAAPRFTGPELLRIFVFGEGQNQEFLTQNNLIQLGPLPQRPWGKKLTDPYANYWGKDEKSIMWSDCVCGLCPTEFLYALPYQHPLILKHVERVLDIDPTLKPEIIPPRKPVLDDIFQM